MKQFLAAIVALCLLLAGTQGRAEEVTLNFSDAPPFHDLGNITAMGIAVALLYSISFLPALVTVLPIRSRGASPIRKRPAPPR